MLTDSEQINTAGYFMLCVANGMVMWRFLCKRDPAVLLCFVIAISGILLFASIGS